VQVNNRRVNVLNQQLKSWIAFLISVPLVLIGLAIILVGGAWRVMEAASYGEKG